LESSDLLKTICPLLPACAASIGDVQVRNKGTIGGSIAHSDPAGDWPAAVLALDAELVLVGTSGERTVKAEDFVVSPGRTVLQPGEILVEFRIPAPKPHSSDCYQRFIPRNEMDIAVVGVGAAVTLNGDTCTAARIGLGAVAPTPLFAKAASDSLVGKLLNEQNIAAATTLAQQIAVPITDMRGTVDYRKHMVGVLTRRVLTEAAARAKKK